MSFSSTNHEENAWREAMRLSLKQQKLSSSVCSNCGYSDIRALQNVKITLCADCRYLLENKHPIELHHLFGRAYPFVIPLLANEHAIISDMIHIYRKELTNNEITALYNFRCLLSRWLELIDLEIEDHKKGETK